MYRKCNLMGKIKNKKDKKKKTLMELYNVPNHQALLIIELAKRIERGIGMSCSSIIDWKKKKSIAGDEGGRSESKVKIRKP